MNKYKNQAFTLVELIVVIIILAILGTIAFITIQGYSAQTRDVKRISDVQNIKKSLELYSISTGKYPLPDNRFEVKYEDELLRSQGTIGYNVSQNLSKNLKEIPLDPLTQTEYTYSTTQSQIEYQLLSVYESDLLSVHINKLLNTTNASSIYSKLDGTYNGVYVKSKTYYIPTPSIINTEITNTGITLNDENIKSQVITGGPNNLLYGTNLAQTGGLDGMSLQAFSGTITIDNDINKAELVEKLKAAYSGCILLSNEGIYKQIIETSNEDYITLIDNLVFNEVVVTSSTSSGGGETSTELITQVDCETAGWYWVDNNNDVYIGTIQGTGFCISPRFGDWNDGHLGDGGISWNGWGNAPWMDYYYGWDASSIDDTANPSSQYGQTRILDSEVSYNCKSLGTASNDYDTSDTIIGRMKWLVTTGNSYTEARSIDWITGLVPHTDGTNPHAIPIIYIADCLDGVKDLGTNMIYTGTGGIVETITYADYSVDKTNTDQSGIYSGCDVISTNTADKDCIIYQNRQKYLTAWTQQSGSHLPSAFSYITSGYASASDIDGNNLIGADRGEYQVACEANLLIDANDDIDNEYIWLSSIGSTSGSYWGYYARFVGYNGCGNQYYGDTGGRDGNRSARFIVRP